jgi:hypothetical protein
MRETGLPSRRLKTSVEKVRDDATGASPTSPSSLPSGQGQVPRNRVTIEQVTAAFGDGHFIAADEDLTTTGDGEGLEAGEKVPVAWKDGKPVVIVFHHSQRAQPRVAVKVVLGVVEELFVATNSKGDVDVYFRNRNQVTPLRVKKHTGGVNPGFVLWGMNDDSFVVRDAGSQTRFHVFKLNRPRKHRVYGVGQVARIKAKLYTVDMNDVTYPVTSVLFRYRRDCGRPYIAAAAHLVANHVHTVGDFCLDVTTNFMHWSNDGVSLNRHSDTMQMDRTIGVTLKGLMPQYTESVAGTRFGSVSAVVSNVLLDKQDELIVSLKVDFTSFGAKTTVDGTTYPGITGSEVSQVENSSTGDGNGTICPFVTVNGDPDPTFGPGVNIFNINETHALVVKARNAAVVFSTILPTTMLTVEHTKEARWQFVADDLHHNIGAVQASLGNYVTIQNQSEIAEDGGAIETPICVEQAHQFGNYFFGQIAGCPTPGGFFIQDTADVSCNASEVQHIEPFDDVVCEVFDAGDVGDEGIVSLQKELFNATLSSLLFTPRQVGAKNDWTGFLSIQGVPGDNGNTVPDHVGFQSAYHRDNFIGCSAGCRNNDIHYNYTGKFVVATATPTFHTIDSVQTYKAEFKVEPFAVEDGELLQFLVLVDRALRPTTWNDGVTPLSGHGSDPSFLTVAILKGNTVREILVNQEVVPQTFDLNSVKLMTANRPHLLWRRGNDFFVSSTFGQTVKVGANADDPKADGLRLTRPDLMYATLEAERYLVRYKTDAGTLTLKQSDMDFPPKEPRLDDLGKLLDLPGFLTPTRKEAQVVNDTTAGPALRLPAFSGLDQEFSGP